MTGSDGIRLPRGRQPRWLKAIFRGVFWLASGGYKVEGLENVPRVGPFILASNHRSYWDPFILSAFLPRTIYFMSKKELFENRLFAVLVRFFGAFPVDRETVRASTFRTAVGLLHQGEVIGIFPEGTIVDSTEESGLKTGVGTLASLGRVPILPVYVTGSDTLFTWRGIHFDCPRLCVRVGAIIPAGQERGREARERAAERAASALIQLERSVSGVGIRNP